MRLVGFWSQTDMHDFKGACRVALAAMPCHSGDRRILCDVSRWQIQAPSTADAFSVWLGANDHGAASRLAIAGASPLLKLQIARVVARGTLKLFDGEAEALRWLTGK